MITIGLVSNWNDTCGIAEYALNLVQHSDPTAVKYRVIPPPFTLQRIMKATQDVDIVHFNYSTRIFDGLNWLLLRAMNKPWVLTLHESSQENVDQLFGNYAPNSRCMFDCVVTHEAFKNARYIPMGFTAVDTHNIEVEHKVGFAGIPFPWKGFYAAAKAAKHNDMGFMAIIPQTHHVDARIAERLIKQVHPQAECIMDWLSYEEVVRKLASCTMNAFPYQVDYDGEYAKAWPRDMVRISQLHGISGAVRMGIAAKRPLIVTHHCQFRDLYDYKDEIHFVDATLEQTVKQVLQEADECYEKRPNRILKDMNWSRCAESYLGVYQELVGNRVQQEVCV